MIDQNKTLIFVIFMGCNTACENKFAHETAAICVHNFNQTSSSSNQKKASQKAETPWLITSFQMACGHTLVLPSALLLHNAQMSLSKLSEGLTYPPARKRKKWSSSFLYIHTGEMKGLFRENTHKGKPKCW